MSLLKEVGIIISDEVVQSLKSAKAIMMIIAYIALMVLGLKLGSFLEILSIFFTESRKAFSLMLPYYISVILLPLFSVLISYDIIAEEMSSKSIKYLASRVNRTSIIIGKYVGAVVISFAMITLAYIIAAVYLYFKLKEIMLFTFLVSCLYLVLYSASIMSIALLFSTITKKPHSALNFSIIALVIFLIMINPLWPAWITLMSPLTYALDALNFLTKQESIIVGISVLGGYIVLCLSCAVLYFRRCDL